MRIKTDIDIRQEIEIDITSEDIQLILNNDVIHVPNILRQFNDIACFMIGLSDEMIALMGVEARKTIVAFLKKQIERLNDNV